MQAVQLRSPGALQLWHLVPKVPSRACQSPWTPGTISTRPLPQSSVEYRVDLFYSADSSNSMIRGSVAAFFCSGAFSSADAEFSFTVTFIAKLKVKLLTGSRPPAVESCGEGTLPRESSRRRRRRPRRQRRAVSLWRGWRSALLRFSRVHLQEKTLY